MKTAAILALALIALPTLSTPGAAPRVELDHAYLASLIDEARTNHPGLRAAEWRVQAARRAVDGVRLWEDPMFRFGGVVGGTPGPDLEMEGDLVYMVQQPLPLFGKATAMRREAESSAALAGAESGYRFQILRRGIVQATLQLALADELLRVGGDDLALLDRMLAFARERQRAGLDSNLELLRLKTNGPAAPNNSKPTDASATSNGRR